MTAGALVADRPALGQLPGARSLRPRCRSGLNVPTFDLDGVATRTRRRSALAGGATRTDVDFGYRGGGTIGDTVFVDINANNTPDPGEGAAGVDMTAHLVRSERRARRRGRSRLHDDDERVGRVLLHRFAGRQLPRVGRRDRPARRCGADRRSRRWERQHQHVDARRRRHEQQPGLRLRRPVDRPVGHEDRRWRDHHSRRGVVPYTINYGNSATATTPADRRDADRDDPGQLDVQCRCLDGRLGRAGPPPAPYTSGRSLRARPVR